MNQSLRYFFFFIMVFNLIGCKKNTLEKIPKSKAYSIVSHSMQKDYNFFVLYPDNFDSTQYYRILILLDANDYFIEMSNILNEEFKNRFILVGVEYNDFKERVEDFTYPYDDEVPNSGQADRYAQFLGNELLSYLENDLRIKPLDKTLLGHSLGGYFATYMQFQQEIENPYDNIIAASPSLWWSDGYVFSLEEKYAKNYVGLKAKFFITMGDLEGAMMNTHFNAFVKRVDSRYSNTEFQFKRYEKMSHRNSPIVSFLDGINFIL